ncbi:MAG: polyprenyl synthetase family protein [Burkholderiales bacterium]|jgi:farnesyl diphosphate synthase|nr:polyprenyl synthetase family protein [Burkholderiales bacterium]
MTLDAERMAQWQAAHRARVDAALQSVLSVPEEEKTLLSAMRYAAFGGKRLRALLVYAAAALTDGQDDVADAPAVAVELIHAYSLAHDDLPCMDDDDLRRGRLACHVRFGEAVALLAGDALQTQAFAVLAKSALSDPAHACYVLAQASGVLGMAGGQARDLETTARDIRGLEIMHQMKTGALIRASVALGASCGVALSPDENTALTRYADRIGLAFQVADDVLDVEGVSDALGKTAGKDAAQNKATYVSLLGLSEAKRLMNTLCEEARSALSLFGERARILKTLATQVVARSH